MAIIIILYVKHCLTSIRNIRRQTQQNVTQFQWLMSQ
jgi:hypothetical protein